MTTLPFLVGITLVTTYFSERLFWGNFRLNIDTADNFVILFIAYGFLSYTLAYFLQRFLPLTPSRAIVAGLIYACIAEVVVAGLLFTMPTTLFFSLPYHVLVTVVIGLVWLPKQLLKTSLLKLVSILVLAGLVHGLWSFGWSSYEEQGVSFYNYIPHITISTLGLIVGYSLIGRVSLADIKFTWFGKSLTTAFFIYIAYVHYGLLALPILVVLSGLLLWLVKLGDQLPEPNEALEQIGLPRNVKRMMVLLIFPLASSISAWVWYSTVPVVFSIQYIVMVPVALYFCHHFYRLIRAGRW